MSVKKTSTKEIPSLVGSTGKVLSSNGANVSWSTIPDASPAVKGVMYGGTDTNGVALGYNTQFLPYQVAIGWNALSSLYSQPLGNVAVGAEALKETVSGYSNTAVGESAGYVTQGNRNTAIGAQSLRAVGGQTGSDNTGVGYRSLYFLIAGNNNTAIGTASGYGTGTNPLTNGSNNTFIGYQSVGASSTASNVITLGNSSIATLRCQVTSISGLSDERDKKDIVDLPVGLDFINGLRPVNFVWNMRPDLDEEGNVISTGKVDIPDMGFIAQDFVAAEDASGIADHLQLTYRDNPEKLEASYGRLVPILVKAIQELTARVEALESSN